MSSIRERATLISVVLLVPAVIGGTIGVLSARYLGGLAIMGPIGVGVVGSVLYIWKGK